MDIAYSLPDLLFELFLKRPKVGGCFGLLVAGVFGTLGVTSWLNLQNLPEQPQALVLQTAGAAITEDPQWVVVQDAHWDCASQTPFGLAEDARVEAIFTDATASVVVVALLAKKVSCAELTATSPRGEISRMTEGRYAYLVKQGRLTPYPQAQVFLELCAYCGPENSLGGVLLGIICVPFGLLLYPVLLLMGRRYRQSSQAITPYDKRDAPLSPWEQGQR